MEQWQRSKFKPHKKRKNKKPRWLRDKMKRNEERRKDLLKNHGHGLNFNQARNWVSRGTSSN